MDLTTILKSKYKQAAVVIPGHGESGNTGLLDYTIGCLKRNNSGYQF